MEKEDGRRKPESEWTESYRRQRGYRETMSLSPKVKLAARLYGTGLVKTKKEAAAIAEISEQHFSNLTGPSGNPELKALMNNVDAAVADQTVDMGAVLQQLGRESIKTINDIRKDSDSELVRLKAAQDLADRSPEVSKTQKTVSTALTIDAKDAAALASALREGSEVADDFHEIVDMGYVGVDLDAAQVPQEFKHLTGATDAEVSGSDEAEGQGAQEQQGHEQP